MGKQAKFLVKYIYEDTLNNSLMESQPKTSAGYAPIAWRPPSGGYF